MIDAFESEVEQIQKLGQYIAYKWSNKPATLANLEELQKEAIGRYAELGFIVNVDVTPALVGVGPPDISIVGRIEQDPDFDHDRKRAEIIKRKQRKNG